MQEIQENSDKAGDIGSSLSSVENNAIFVERQEEQEEHLSVQPTSDLDETVLAVKNQQSSYFEFEASVDQTKQISYKDAHSDIKEPFYNPNDVSNTSMTEKGFINIVANTILCESIQENSSKASIEQQQPDEITT